MNEIHILPTVESIKELCFRICYLVPSHCRHLFLMQYRFEPPYVGVENADAVNISLIGMSAQQLLSDANTEYRLSEVTNHHVEFSFLQIFHCASSLPLSWEEHLVSLHKPFGVVGKVRFYSHSS